MATPAPAATPIPPTTGAGRLITAALICLLRERLNDCNATPAKAVA